MTLPEVLFWVFAGIAALASIGIAVTRNVIHAALLLVVVILSLASIFVLFHAEFLAVVHVLVYAGGVVVLLAFGIMLTRRPADGRLLSDQQMIVPALLVVLPLFYLLYQTVERLPLIKPETLIDGNQVRQIGIGFMTQQLLAFELIAFLLLVVLVGAAYLAKKSNEVD